MFCMKPQVKKESVFSGFCSCYFLTSLQPVEPGRAPSQPRAYKSSAMQLWTGPRLMLKLMPAQLYQQRGARECITWLSFASTKDFSPRRVELRLSCSLPLSTFSSNWISTVALYLMLLENPFMLSTTHSRCLQERTWPLPSSTTMPFTNCGLASTHAVSFDSVVRLLALYSMLKSRVKLTTSCQKDTSLLKTQQGPAVQRLDARMLQTLPSVGVFIYSRLSFENWPASRSFTSLLRRGFTGNTYTYCGQGQTNELA